MGRSIALGWYLAIRTIKRTSFISKVFIVFVMTLTFLNLLVVRGVLVGIPDSSLENARRDDTGDVLISRLDGELQIDKTFEMTQYLERSPLVKDFSVRYQTSASVESDFKRSKKEGLNASRRTVPIRGVDPRAEEAVTQVSRFIVDGRMINPGETGVIVLGSGLLANDAPNFSDEDQLQNVSVDSSVLVTISGFTKEYRVVGIVESKGQIDNSGFILDTELRSLLGRTNPNASEIAIRLKDSSNETRLVEQLKAQTFGTEAKFQTSEEAVGEFLNDIKTIFDFLSTFVGLIGVFISAITIFIIIFVNAVSRRQEIGITRAVGVPQSVIITSYFFQAICYAIAGIVVALAVFFGLLEPFFRANPIDFPFTEVYLSVDAQAITIQALILLVAGGLAGYIPSRMIIKQNVISLILGR